MHPIPEFVSFLYEKFKQQLLLREVIEEDYTIKEFVEWCSEYLKSNQPVQVTYLEKGLGLRLQQGEVVSFIEQTQLHQMQPANAVPITSPIRTFGRDNFLPANDVAVTGQ